MKHRSRSFEDFEKEGRFEGVEKGRGYRGTWYLLRAELNRDAGEQAERTLPCGYGR